MQTIYLDISNRGVIPVIYAKQGDVGRKAEVVLTNSGLPYEPEAGSAFSAWFSGASGVGNYTEIGGKPAFSVSGNKVTVELITQMLQNAGEGFLCLVLSRAGGDQIGMWNIRYICEGIPGAGSEPAKDYYTAFSQAVAGLAYPDASLSVAGKAADAEATGKALEGKAPAGYVDTIYSVSNFDGLLATVNTVLSAMDSKKEARLAFAVSNWTDYIPSGEYLVMVYKEADGYATLTAKCNTAQLQNQLYNGAWQPWGWVNPPMVPGVEYRTTERWNGKPVWKSLTKITGLPNTAHGMYNLAATYCECMVGKHISYERSDGADFLDYVEAGKTYFGNYGTPYIVFDKTQADLSNVTAYVTLFYTKTTD